MSHRVLRHSIFRRLKGIGLEGFRREGFRLAGFGIASLCLVLSSPLMALPFYTITVTITQDVDAADGDCSLREALNMVNSSLFAETFTGCVAIEKVGGSEHTVSLMEETYPLTISRLEITTLDAIKIQGPEEGAVIDGRNGGRLFHIDNGNDAIHTAVSFINLTLKKGDGEEDLGDSEDKTAAGGIYSREALSLEHVILTDNEADNSAALRQVGGSLSISHSMISENESDRSKGSVYVSGASELSITNSVFYHNTNWSGAILELIDVGNVAIENSAFIANTISFDCGGIIKIGCIPFSDNLGTIGIINSTVAISNSTVSGNVATLSGAAAIYASNSDLSIRYSTIYNNFIDSPDSDDNSSFDHWVGGVYLDSGVTAVIANSVLSGNSGYSDGGGSPLAQEFDCFGESPLNSEGFNFFGNVDGCDIVAVTNGGTDVFGADPKLGPLSLGSLSMSHDSAEYVHLPQFESPLLDAIDLSNEACLEQGLTDQRSIARPQVEGCDIGSVERRALVLSDDVVETKQLETLVFSILSNDFITEADVSSIEFFGELVHGSYTYDVENDQFSYVVNSSTVNIEGTVTDSLSYQIIDEDGFTSNVASITVSVRKYLGPVFSELPIFTVDPEVITPLGIIFGDQFLVLGDAELDYASFKLVEEPNDGLVVCVCLNVVGAVELGNLSYSPDDDFSGADSFTFQIADHNGLYSEPVVVNLNVLPLPEEDDDDGGSISWILLTLLGSGYWFRRKH
ncbi:MAG: hypothetical protein COB51_09875 [Moraxellaceae bacterium]|nr:MAG: hypothetical protein COB51_09875 [Moraxellaceae bacterium]